VWQAGSFLRGLQPLRPVRLPRALNGEWERVRLLVLSGEMSQRKAAETLGVGRATVARLLARNVGQTTAPESLV
jgi:predicted DNA-binding protein (UPF0251 family)